MKGVLTLLRFSDGDGEVVCSDGVAGLGELLDFHFGCPKFITPTSPYNFIIAQQSANICNI